MTSSNERAIATLLLETGNKAFFLQEKTMYSQCSHTGAPAPHSWLRKLGAVTALGLVLFNVVDVQTAFAAQAHAEDTDASIRSFKATPVARR